MNLSENWITENALDFEYKKYLLLAYFQDVNKDFSSNKIYPSLKELINHYKNILSIKEAREKINSAQADLKKIDLQNYKLVYETAEDTELMAYMNELIEFSQPHFSYYINEGQKIYDFVEQQLRIEPVGVIPFGVYEGYLLAHDGKQSEVNAYEYQIMFFENQNEKYRAIHTSFVDSYEVSLVTNYLKIKQDIIQKQQKMPNPAVFVIKSDLEFPLNETFLPIAKRVAVKYISV